MAEAVVEVTATPVNAGREALVGWTTALVSAAAFGTSGAFAKPLLATGWSAGAVVAIRLGLAAAVLLVPGLVALRGRWRLLLAHWRPIVCYGVFGGATAQVFTIGLGAQIGVLQLGDFGLQCEQLPFGGFRCFWRGFEGVFRVDVLILFLLLFGHIGCVPVA